MDIVKRAIAQLWVFWVAPILGAIAAGFLYNYLFSQPTVAETELD